MLFKAKRFKSVEKSDVSPASFNFQTTYSSEACRVPFNCSAPAQALADIDKVPAPCTYNITFRKHRILGGVSLQFTSGRETFKNEFHHPEIETETKTTEIVPKCTIPGKIFKGKLPRYEETSSDSFESNPSGVFFFSENLEPFTYYLNGGTKLIKPVQCDFPYEINSISRKYKGNHWSIMRSSRSQLQFGDVTSPGVGAYNLLDKPPNPCVAFYDKIKFYNKLRAKSLRTLDLLVLRLKTLDEPGPADYEVVTSCNKLRSIHNTGTFSKAERKTLEMKSIPQSDLNISKCFKKKSFQKCWPPFNSSSKLMKSLKSSKRSPADIVVWNYTIAYRLAKELSFPRVVAPFNSSSERICLFGATEDYPEPGAYNIQRFPTQQKCIFGAKDANSYEPPLKLVPSWQLKQKEIAPCTYEVDASFKVLSKKRDFHRGEVWKSTNRDRFGWLIKKDSPDVLYTIGGRSQCLWKSRKLNERLGPLPTRKMEFKPRPVSFYYVNRLARRVAACLGVSSPAPRHVVPAC